MASALFYKTVRMGATPKEYLMARVKVDPVTGCWNWTESTFRMGHGRFSCVAIGPQMHASRGSWFIHKGDPGDMLVCHSCDNPPCCNPDHLFLGTYADNSEDCVSKGRHAYGVKQGRAKLNDEKVRAIRWLNGPGLMARKEIAGYAGVSVALIDQVMQGKIWSHVT